MEGRCLSREEREQWSGEGAVDGARPDFDATTAIHVHLRLSPGGADARPFGGRSYSPSRPPHRGPIELATRGSRAPAVSDECFATRLSCKSTPDTPRVRECPATVPLAVAASADPASPAHTAWARGAVGPARTFDSHPSEVAGAGGPGRCRTYRGLCVQGTSCDCADSPLGALHQMLAEKRRRTQRVAVPLRTGLMVSGLPDRCRAEAVGRWSISDRGRLGRGPRQVSRRES